MAGGCPGGVQGDHGVYFLKGLDIHHVSVTGEEIVNNSACGVVTQWCDHGNLRKGEMESLDVHHVSVTGEGIMNSGAYKVVAQWCDCRNLRKGGGEGEKWP